MGWDSAIDEMADESEHLSQEINDAEQVRSTDSDISDDRPGVSSKPWWAIRLMQVLPIKNPRKKPEITVISACSGCLAEGEVLKASWQHVWAAMCVVKCCQHCATSGDRGQARKFSGNILYTISHTFKCI